MKTLIKISAALALLLALSGCITTATNPPVRDVAMKTSFDPSSLDHFLAGGTGSIKGQAFLTTRGGDVKVAAGREVILWPMTDFTEEALDHIERGYRPAAYNEARPQILKAVKRTQADAEGRFEFLNLAAGRYWAEVEITWMVPGPYGGSRTGGIVRRELSVAEGAETKLMLTR